jgi:oligosaccharide repeat unit polymerase
MKLGKILNPVNVFCFSYLIADISVLLCENLDLLRGLLVIDSKNSIEIYNYAIIIFIIPWLIFSTKGIKRKNFHFSTKRDIVITKYASYILLCSILITVFYLGGLPIFKMILGETNVSDHNKLIESLPFGLLSIVLNVSIIFSLYLASILFNRKKNNTSFVSLSLWIIICLLASIWQGKRQGLLIFLFFIIARFSQSVDVKYIINIINIKFLKRAIVYIILVVAFANIFFSVNAIRNNREEIVDNELFQYAMYPPMNLSKIIANNDYSGSTFYPNFILTEILPQRFREDNSLELKKYLFEPTSPSGYLSFWYLDYGIYGVIIGTYLLSISSLHFYKRRNISEKNMRYYIFILWCCVTVSTYSHFISLNFFILPFIIMKLLDKIKIAA